MLHSIQPQQKKKRAKRVGRGGKRGTYSGRGLKGQKARAGNSKRPAERDLIIRLPKRRGFRNKPKSAPAKVVNVSDIEKAFSAGDAVTANALIEKGVLLVRKSDRDAKNIKILGNGILTKAVQVQGLAVSATAREKIEKAGGSVQ